MSISRDVGNAVLLRPYSFQTIYTSVASSRRNRRDNHNHTECIHSYLLSPFSTSATCLPTGIKYINWYKIQNVQAVTADRQEPTTDTTKKTGGKWDLSKPPLLVCPGMEQNPWLQITSYSAFAAGTQQLQTFASATSSFCKHHTLLHLKLRRGTWGERRLPGFPFAQSQKRTQTQH
jgi:hypothetical protein